MRINKLTGTPERKGDKFTNIWGYTYTVASFSGSDGKPYDSLDEAKLKNKDESVLVKHEENGGFSRLTDVIK